MGQSRVFRADGSSYLADDPVPAGEGMRFTYYWIYLPKGTMGRSSALFANRHAFDGCLQTWNRQGGQHWKYTAEAPLGFEEEPTGDKSTCLAAVKAAFARYTAAMGPLVGENDIVWGVLAEVNLWMKHHEEEYRRAGRTKEADALRDLRLHCLHV